MDSRLFHDYPIVEGPRSVSGAQAERLKELMAQIYRIDWPNLRCSFQPRYGLTFQSFPGGMDVLICPGCREVRYFGGATGVRRASLGPHTESVLSILRELFPETAQQ